MAKVDMKAVEALLQEIASENVTSPAGRWLSGDGEVDALDASDALVAIEAARRLEQGERLVEAKGAKNKAVRKAAGKAIHSLRGAGVEVSEERTQGSWSMGTETREEIPPVGLIGLPQGDGYFPYILVAHGHGGACVCAGIAGAGKGFQDSDHAHVGRSRAREIVDNARRDHNLTEVPFHVALHFTERAFDEGGGKRPHGWSHMLESVPEATRNSARLIDPLQRQDKKMDAKAIENIDSLLEGSHRVVFNLPEQISGPAVDGCLSALTSELAINDDDRRMRITREVAKSATEVMDGDARASWILALDVVTCIAETAEQDDLRQAARHTSLAMREGLKGEDIPFVRQWVERQLLAVTEMVMSVRAGREDQST